MRVVGGGDERGTLACLGGGGQRGWGGGESGTDRGRAATTAGEEEGKHGEVKRAGERPGTGGCRGRGK